MTYPVAYNRYIAPYFPGMGPLKPTIRAERRVGLDLDDPVLKGNIAKYFEAGTAPVAGHPDSIDWYMHTKAALQDMLGGDEHKANLVIDLLASTSPQCSIIENIYRSLFWLTALEEHWLYELKEKFEAHFNNCCRSLLGLPLSGRKVSNFQANLRGDPNAVTVDTWMMRAFGLRNIRKEREAKGPSTAEYDAVADAVTQFAAQYGVQPCQMQAALWVGIKRLYGDPADTAKPFEEIFRDVKGEIDRQSTFDFDGMISNYAADGKAKQHTAGHEAAMPAISAEDAPADPVGAVRYDLRDIPDVVVGDNPMRAYNRKGDPVYGGSLAFERVYSVAMADAAFITYDAHNKRHLHNAISQFAIDYLFFVLDNPIHQTMAIYYLREHSQRAIQEQHEISAHDIHDGMQNYTVLQPITLGV